jgi:hypothetical protein
MVSPGTPPSHGQRRSDLAFARFLSPVIMTFPIASRPIAMDRSPVVGCSLFAAGVRLLSVAGDVDRLTN